MRIIDKNTDFYDYLQDVYKDNTLTFDRTDSFVVSKEIMCQHLIVNKNYSRFARKYSPKHYNFLLLQICHTFWLFLVNITEIMEYGMAKDYQIELLTKWENYDKKRVLISLENIVFGYGVALQAYKESGISMSGYDRERIINRIDVFVQAVNNNDYRVKSKINKHLVRFGNHGTAEKHIPLLKACGIAQCVNPLDVYLAFEKYFSLEKSDSERTEAIGTTNRDKIESHGFDYVTSFRGKNKGD